jgi:hypothetical protein
MGNLEFWSLTAAGALVMCTVGYFAAALFIGSF